jgi:hypothetical protein
MWWNLNQSKSKEQEEEEKKRDDNEIAEKKAYFKKLIECMGDNPELIKELLAVIVICNNFETKANIISILKKYDIDGKKQI